MKKIKIKEIILYAEDFKFLLLCFLSVSKKYFLSLNLKILIVHVNGECLNVLKSPLINVNLC